MKMGVLEAACVALFFDECLENILLLELIMDWI
jgi:hypothetical protein